MHTWSADPPRSPCTPCTDTMCVRERAVRVCLCASKNVQTGHSTMYNLLENRTLHRAWTLPQTILQLQYTGKKNTRHAARRKQTHYLAAPCQQRHDEPPIRARFVVSAALPPPPPTASARAVAASWPRSTVVIHAPRSGVYRARALDCCRTQDKGVGGHVS